MRVLLLTISIALIFFEDIFAQPCPFGDIEFNWQVDLDNFVMSYPDCTTINGSLIIQSIGNSSSEISDISDLSPLSKIERIEGDLIFYVLFSLEELTGLNKLNYVGGNLSIRFAKALKNYHGLESLKLVDGFFQIDNNTPQNCSGLENLSQVGNLMIYNDDNLTSLKGLENLKIINDGISIVNNTKLSSLNSLKNLQDFQGVVDIFLNKNLTSLAGIGNLNPLGITELRLQNNDNLNICNVKSICTYLEIDSNPSVIEGNKLNCISREEIIASCQTSNIENFLYNNISISPNPCFNKCTIKAPSQTIITLIDLRGKIIKRFSNTTEEIDLSNERPGIYFCQFLNGEEQITLRLLKV